ncbi:DPP IV N-terminal domain-containing protein [Antarcticibacterium sp. 1MA-6-2]|uniref:DPP IV N-terminal domain-containing protein n=1 Tax=Antarcticibacterium sp. 1MA-6-2 TaxID=2908210 RepID=UPI002102603A|nr:DPP IV N-terminal domain-containing protein [Antarcticibacterium sp. 1MA-6-2]
MFFIFSTFSIFSNFRKKVYTAADYEEAVNSLGFNTYNLVDRASVRPNWLEDGRFWYEVSTNAGKGFVLVDPAKKSRKTAASKEELLKNVKVPDEAKQAKTSRNEVVSPDGKNAVFIRDWNLWMKNLETGAETQLTTDGTENFGYATDNA